MKEANYRSLDSFYKEKFGCKVCKVSLNCGMTCPNKDGTKGKMGCLFCNGSVGIGKKEDDLLTQFNTVKSILQKKWSDAKYIPFLEANTNTYAPLETLKSIYEPLIKLDGVVGLAIATRCDAITEEVYDYLEELNTQTYVSIELGLQSSHNATLKDMNRGHTVDEFTKCVRELRNRNIDVVVHIINGLPHENMEMMLDTIKYINGLDIQGIKFHMLYIEEGTLLEKMYKKEPFYLLSRDEYFEIVSLQLQLLNKSVVVHRLISGPDNKKLIAPKWLIGKFKNLNAIENYFYENDVFQGKKNKES